MKITFFSSVLNHHQISFCDEMYRLHGDNFRFVSTMEMEAQRKQLKYVEYDRPYKIKMHVSENNRFLCDNLFQNSDIVILGVPMQENLRRRICSGKITFLYRERLFKKKPSLYWYLRCMAYILKEFWRYKKSPLYMLAASAYVPQDYSVCRLFRDKIFSWGYFPPCRSYDESSLMKSKESKTLHLFWAGRFLKWKNPLYVIEVARKLKENNLDFHIDIAGTGELENEMQNAIKNNSLHREITLRGALPPEQVRDYMEKANIYLFTSNREEGFGAVLIEAMNSGCAVVASETAGATKLLVHDGINGKIYGKDSVVQLCKIVLELAKDRAEIERLGRKAYLTIRSSQNATVAAKRLTQVFEAMYKKELIPVFNDGPMQKWYCNVK